MKYFKHGSNPPKKRISVNHCVKCYCRIDDDSRNCPCCGEKIDEKQDGQGVNEVNILIYEPIKTAEKISLLGIWNRPLNVPNKVKKRSLAILILSLSIVIVLIALYYLIPVLRPFAIPTVTPIPLPSVKTTPTVTATAEMTATAVPTLTSTPTEEPPPTTTTEPTTSPSQVERTAVVSAPFGGGAILRETPSGNRLNFLPNDTVVILLDDPQQIAGSENLSWQKVQVQIEEETRIGWVAANLIQEQP